MMPLQRTQRAIQPGQFGLRNIMALMFGLCLVCALPSLAGWDSQLYWAQVLFFATATAPGLAYLLWFTLKSLRQHVFVRWAALLVCAGLMMIGWILIFRLPPESPISTSGQNVTKLSIVTLFIFCLWLPQIIMIIGFMRLFSSRNKAKSRIVRSFDDLQNREGVSIVGEREKA